MAELAVHDMGVHGNQRQRPINDIFHPVIHKVQRSAGQKDRGIIGKIGLQQFLIAVLHSTDSRCHKPAGVATDTGTQIFLVGVNHPNFFRASAQSFQSGGNCRVVLRQSIDD